VTNGHAVVKSSYLTRSDSDRVSFPATLRTTTIQGVQNMGFKELKAAVLALEPNDQKRLITEVLTEIMPKVCTDEACLSQIRHFVDEETVKSYKEQHMDGI
jgi:hypothetical protein